MVRLQLILMRLREWETVGFPVVGSDVCSGHTSLGGVSYKFISEHLLMEPWSHGIMESWSHGVTQVQSYRSSISTIRQQFKRESDKLSCSH